MKQKLLASFVAILATCSMAEAKLYLGIEGGWNGNASTFSSFERDKDKTLLDSKSTLKEQGVIGNLILGTEHFFGKGYFGLRWGIFAGYGSAWDENEGKDTQLDTLSLGLNFDLMVNFVARENIASGMFAGLEYAYGLLIPKDEIKIGKTINGNNYFVSNKTNINDVIVRVGFTTAVAKHHRFEIMAKIPVMPNEMTSRYAYKQTINQAVTKDDENKYTFDYKHIQALVSYKYIF